MSLRMADGRFLWIHYLSGIHKILLWSAWGGAVVDVTKVMDVQGLLLLEGLLLPGAAYLKRGMLHQDSCYTSGMLNQGEGYFPRRIQKGVPINGLIASTGEEKPRFSLSPSLSLSLSLMCASSSVEVA